jgi:hypothetical protein
MSSSTGTTTSTYIEEVPLNPPPPPSSSTPVVLTRTAIPSLTQGLDAGDVLEVYSLVRQAPLHGLANATLRVHKMALGFRFRPTDAAIVGRNKEPLELTLEYGPQRFGPLLLHEAMPFIQMDDDSAFVSWENVGKVYYTTEISSELYLSANYMASMKGAVLGRILQEAVNYAGQRRRYQPFSVYTAETRKELLRSSSSADFTEYMWRHLAELGVEVEPILVPPMYEARLWVAEVSKEIPDQRVAQRAATFYRKLYLCIESIAFGDYSAYMPTSSPSLSFSPTALPTQTVSPSLSPSSAPTKPANTTSPSAAPRTQRPTLRSNETFVGGRGDVTLPPTALKTIGTNHGTGTQNQTVNGAADSDTQGSSEQEGGGGNHGTKWRYRTRHLDEKVSLENTTSAAPTDSISQVPSAAPTVHPLPSSGQDVENAQKAAQEAQDKANEAKEAAHTEGDSKAADAAQAAASAAQKAADATSNAASQAAMASLLSGDGHTMSSIISTCFSNPLYDIASIDRNGTFTSHAYLYRDGSLYYKLNMTSPFFDIVKVERTLPKATTFADYGSGGDFVDWTLAIFLLGTVVLGLLVILQQIGFHFFEPLYKCQTWFFNPRQTRRTPDFNGSSEERGQEPVFMHGEEAIPLSMGGRLTSISPIRQQTLYNGAMNETSAKIGLPDLPGPNNRAISPALSFRGGNGSSGDSFGEIELQRFVSNTPQRRDRSDSFDSAYSNESFSRDSPDPTSGAFRKRFARNPDLVDLPHLKSKSKVAVPVGLNDSGSDGDPFGSDF